MQKVILVDQDKCIGCTQCLAVCRFGAVKCNWGEETEVLQKSMAEHALGVLKTKQNRAAFFNFLFSITDECDCFDNANMPKIVGDIGITASTDPVAIDKASLDLAENKAGKKLPKLLKNEDLNPLPQIEHARRIGLGRRGDDGTGGRDPGRDPARADPAAGREGDSHPG